MSDTALRSRLGDLIGNPRDKAKLDSDVLKALEWGLALVDLNDPRARGIEKAVRALVREQRGAA